MNIIRWLYPGIGVKRWLLALGAGAGMAVFGGVALLEGWELGMIATAGGVAMMAFSALMAIRSIVRALMPQHADRVIEMLYRQNALGRGPKIVVIGGGTGLSTLLRGIKEFTSNLTAIVTVADDGGSSGRLRKDMGVLPPGDIRNCLVALADSEPLMARLFEYRFPEGEAAGLGGHAFGNLFIATMSAITGDFEEAVKESSRVLAVRGRVLPSTLENVVLAAECDGGLIVDGESTISKCGARIKRVFLRPGEPKALPEAIEAIRDADAIVLGPGSLFTSVLPNLLVKGMVDVIRETQVPRIYVCNVMTQPGETDGFTAADHVQALADHVGTGFLDCVLVNVGGVPPRLVEKYRQENAHPVVADTDRISAWGISVIEDDLISDTDYARHDPERLARAIVRLIVDGKSLRLGRLDLPGHGMAQRLARLARATRQGSLGGGSRH